MKLKFKDQDFQTAAVEAVAGLFAGQERSRATFSVMEEGQLPDQTSFGPAKLGVGNVLRLTDDALTANMRAVQKRNLLPMTDSAASRQFCVEMETGTGKTHGGQRGPFVNPVSPSGPTRSASGKGLQTR